MVGLCLEIQAEFQYTGLLVENMRALQEKQLNYGLVCCTRLRLILLILTSVLLLDHVSNTFMTCCAKQALHHIESFLHHHILQPYLCLHRSNVTSDFRCAEYSQQ